MWQLFWVRTSTEILTTREKCGFWICQQDYRVGTSHHSCQLKLSPQHLRKIQPEESRKGHLLALISSVTYMFRPVIFIPDIREPLADHKLNCIYPKLKDFFTLVVHS